MRVEPDVFIRFSDFDIIIEAKRYNENQQHRQQLENQTIAYYNEYADEGRDLYYIKLGGLWNKEQEDDFIYELENKISYSDDGQEFISTRKIKIPIGKTTWTIMLDSVISERRIFSQNGVSFINSYVRILDDMVTGFEMHGFYRKQLIKELRSPRITSIDFPYFSSLKKSPERFNLKSLKSTKIQLTETNVFDYAKRKF